MKVSSLYLRDKAIKKHKNYNRHNGAGESRTFFTSNDNSCYTVSENDY